MSGVLSDEQVQEVEVWAAGRVGRIPETVRVLLSAYEQNEQLLVQRDDQRRENVRLMDKNERLREALETIAYGDYEGRKLWEHKLAADALSEEPQR